MTKMISYAVHSHASTSMFTICIWNFKRAQN